MAELSTSRPRKIFLLMLFFSMLIGISACDFGSLFVDVGQPTPTGVIPVATLTTSPPSATIESTQSPIATSTPHPTGTPTNTPTPPPDFILQLGSPRAIPNVFRPELGCNWMGIAGQVFGPDESPLLNIVVEVGGALAGEPYMGLGMTGSTPFFGIGGFEVTLADHPLATHGTLWVELYGLDGQILTERIYFDTYDSCEQNLIIMNFSPFESIPGQIFLPLINQ